MMIRKKSVLMGALFAVLFLFSASSVPALSVGQKIWNVKLRSASDKPRWIPYLGKKVVLIFYADPDAADQNDPFADKVKAANFPAKYVEGIGVVNMKDTWKPNFAIRMVVRQKIKKYKAIILTDPSYLLKKSWRLGNCNNKSVVIIIGKDRKVHYYYKGRMNSSQQKKALKIMGELAEKAKAG